MNNTERVDEAKLEKAIESTNFNVLKIKKNEGFEEAAYSKDEQRKFLILDLIIDGKIVKRWHA